MKPQEINTLQPQSKNQIIVQAHCRNEPINLLIDTGANLSIVNTRFIQQSDWWGQVRPTTTLIAGLAKTVIPLRGEIELPITLSSITTVHKFVVCDEVDNEFLIGIDVLKEIGATIDLPNKKVTIPRGEVPFLTKPISINHRHKIRCNKNVTLKPNSAGYIWGKLPIRESGDNFEGVIEPYEKMAANNGVFITGSLSYTRKNLIKIHYVNVEQQAVTIYRNQLLAFFEPLEGTKGVQAVHRVTREDEYSYDARINIPRLPDAISVEETVRRGKWKDPQNLHEQLGIDNMEIPETYKNKLKDLITEFSHCFSAFTKKPSK